MKLKKQEEIKLFSKLLLMKLLSLLFIFLSISFSQENIKLTSSYKNINSVYIAYKTQNTTYFLKNPTLFESKTFAKIFLKNFPLENLNKTQIEKILNIYKKTDLACNLFFLYKDKKLPLDIKIKIEKILFKYCPHEPYVKSIRNKFSSSEDIYKRAKLLFEHKQFKDAFFYAKKLPLNQDKYKYLVSRIYFKNRKRKYATYLMESINSSAYKYKKYYFLSLWKRKSDEKKYYFEKLLSTKKKNLIKIVLNGLLNYAFYQDNSTFFFYLLNISKNVDKNLYGIYGFRYYYSIGDYKKAKNFINFIKNKDTKTFYSILVNRFLDKDFKLENYLNNFSNFSKYKIILNPPKKIKNQAPKLSDIKNKYLKKYLKEDPVFAKILLETFKFDFLDKALAYYFLKNYYLSIVYASKYKNKISKHLFLYHLLYPQGYKKEIRYFLKLYKSKLPENYIYALIRQESLFNEKAISWAGAKGLMQIMPFTAKFICKKLKINYDFYNLTQPKYNLRLGIWYADFLYRRLKDLALVSGAYNAGPGNIRRFIGDITPCYSSLEFLEVVDFFVKYPETRNYILKTLRNFYIYNAIYNKEGNYETTCTISP